MAKIDKALDDILKKYHDNPKEAIWDCHGTWVAYHKALEQIAVKAGIEFSPPHIVEADGANKVAAVCVVGTLGDRTEWSIGEASPANNRNAYPWAMAEKRAKDRVILKLIGLHGMVYSEEEADDFKPVTGNGNGNVSGSAEKKGNPPGITKFRAELREFYRDLNACSDYDEYVALVNSPPAMALIERARNEFPDDWHGDGGDIKGIRNDMAEVCNRLKAEQEQAA